MNFLQGGVAVCLLVWEEGVAEGERSSDALQGGLN